MLFFDKSYAIFLTSPDKAALDMEYDNLFSLVNSSHIELTITNFAPSLILLLINNLFNVTKINLIFTSIIVSKLL